MKRIIEISTCLIFFNMSVQGQANEYYTIEDALQNQASAKSLYLNYCFQEIKPISESISELRNLEEFRIQNRWFNFPKIENKKVVDNKIDESESKSPHRIPNGITRCQNLKLIDISNTEIEELPTDFGLLDNLEILILNYSQINLTNEFVKIKQLKGLKEIQLVGIDLSKSQSEEFAKMPNLKVVSSLESLKKQINEDEAVDVQLHDTYFVFQNEEQANRFINSMPHELGKKVNIYKNDNR